MPLTPTPLTTTQIPEKSILDIFGRQTYLGNAYALTPPGFALATVTETPIILFTVPGNSPVSIFSYNRRATAATTLTEVKFYGNPTVTSNGTLTTATNARTGSKNTSKTVCYLNPVVSANGRFSTILPATTGVTEITVLSILDPGTTLLVTAQQTAATPSILYLGLFWYEV